MTELEQALRSRGIPLTLQRQAIYEALKRSKEHPSAESIHTALKKRYPSLSLATVYKTLQTLEKVGLACLVNRPHAQARYDAITERHHHAICDACGRIEDLFDERLDRLPVPAAAAAGFEINGHSVHFRGLCKRCAPKSTRRKR